MKTGCKETTYNAMTKELYQKAEDLQSKIHQLGFRIINIEAMRDKGFDACILSPNGKFCNLGLSADERKEIAEILLENAKTKKEEYEQMFNNL